MGYLPLAGFGEKGAFVFAQTLTESQGLIICFFLEGGGSDLHIDGYYDEVRQALRNLEDSPFDKILYVASVK